MKPSSIWQVKCLLPFVAILCVFNANMAIGQSFTTPGGIGFSIPTGNYTAVLGNTNYFPVTLQQINDGDNSYDGDSAKRIGQPMSILTASTSTSIMMAAPIGRTITSAIANISTPSPPPTHGPTHIWVIMSMISGAERIGRPAGLMTLWATTFTSMSCGTEANGSMSG